MKYNNIENDGLDNILENNRYKIINIYKYINVFMEFLILHFLHNKTDIKT